MERGAKGIPIDYLVTGGAGFMGSSFIRECLADKAFEGRVVNLDLLTYAGNLDNLRTIAEDPRYTFVEGDIRDESLLKELGAFDYVVHFAAESHVDRSIEGPRTFLETNILGTFTLLEFVRRHPGTHFHHISTDEVYGELGCEGYFFEDSSYKPNSPYSASKAAADHFVRAYVQTYGISATVSHATNNFGPCQYPEKFIPLMISNLLHRKPLPVYGRGENARDWLFVRDHSRAVKTILEKGQSGEVYNISGENVMSNLDLLHLIIEGVADLTGEDAEGYRELITFVADRPGHDFRYALDPSKIKKELGWTADFSLKEGLNKTIKWYYDRHEENRLCHSRAP